MKPNFEPSKRTYIANEVALPPAPEESAHLAGMREITHRLVGLREWDTFDLNRVDPSQVRRGYKITDVIEHAGGVYAVAPLGDGRRFYLSGYHGLALAYQMSTSEPTRGGTWWEQQPIATIPGKGFTLQLLPDGSLVTGGGDGAIRIHSRTDQRARSSAPWTTTTITVSEQPLYAVQALPANAIVSGGADGTVRILQGAGQGSWLGEDLPRTSAVHCLQVLPNNRIVVGTSDGYLRVWKRTGSGSWGCAEVEAHNGPLNCLKVLASGRIVTGGADGIVRVWHDTGYAIHHSRDLTGHTGAIHSLHVLSDCTILSGSADMTIRIWREGPTPAWRRLMGSGSPWRWTSTTLKGHTGDILSATFMHDGSILSASTDGTARVWRGR